MIGTTLAYYRVTAELGAGGMGEVWRATDTKLGREVALKVLPEEFAKDPDRLARFEREAKMLASLNHPSIAHLNGLETAISSGTGSGSDPSLRPQASSPPTQIPRRGADTPLARDDNEGREGENSKLETQNSELTSDASKPCEVQIVLNWFAELKKVAGRGGAQ